MKTEYSRLKIVLVIAVALSVMHEASAFYDAHLGRWITRDPIGEDGGKNLYLFVGNNAINAVDAFGKIKFDGCELKEQQVAAGFESYCKKLDDPAFKCCLDHFNLPSRLKWMCDNRDNLTIKCESRRLVVVRTHVPGLCLEARRSTSVLSSGITRGVEAPGAHCCTR